MTTQQIQFQTLQETKRSNLAREAETNRSNLAHETETHRSNVAKEFETNRSNVAKESETSRHNKAGETYDYVKMVNDDIQSGLNRGKDLVVGLMRSASGLASIFGG